MLREENTALVFEAPSIECALEASQPAENTSKDLYLEGYLGT